MLIIILDFHKKRADAIKNYLVKNGIAANEINAIGYGEKMPKSHNSIESGRTPKSKNSIYYFEKIEFKKEKFNIRYNYKK